MRIWVVFTLLWSASAWACPDLAGSYSCIFKDGSSELIQVSQEARGGVTVYHYNNTEIPADNHVYHFPDDDVLRQGTFRAWCEDDEDRVLRTQLAGRYYSENTFHGDLVLDTSYKLVGTDLQQISTGVLKQATGDRAINTQVICKRQ